MAKQTNGYMGGFSGKLGPAVGYQWNGVWCLRARPRIVHNPRTEKQMAHRQCFKQMVQLAARMRWAVTTGLTAVARQMHLTAQNLFINANMQAFSEVDDVLEVDYSRLQLSAGPVAPVALGDVAITADGVLSVEFERNPMHLSASQFDSVYLYLYCPEIGQGYLAAPVYRNARRISLVLPTMYLGREIHLYAFVMDEHRRASVTAYGGCGVATAEPEAAFQVSLSAVAEVPDGEEEPGAPAMAHDGLPTAVVGPAPAEGGGVNILQTAT